LVIMLILVSIIKNNKFLKVEVRGAKNWNVQNFKMSTLTSLEPENKLKNWSLINVEKHHFKIFNLSTHKLKSWGGKKG
jgi:hypothetical protein